MNVKNFVIGFISIFLSWQSLADDQFSKLRVLDRLSISLKGVPASGEEKEAYLNEDKTLEDLALEYKGSEEFQERLTTYWLDALHIKDKVSFDAVFIPGGRNLANELAAGVFQRSTVNKTLQFVRNAYQHRCQGSVANAAQKAFYNQNCCRQARTAGMTVKEFQPADPVTVNPWWAPQQTVNVCPGLLQANSCGANLKECFPTDFTLTNPNLTGIPIVADNYYVRNLHDAFTFEPGRIISRVIVEDRPWDEVLTTNKSMATGTMQHFLKNTKWGAIIVNAAPPGTWQDADGIVNLAQADDPTDNKWYPVEHNDTKRHAGVLSTLAFHKSANGHYAKANVAMEAFLCKAFSAPKGSKIPPSEETEPSQKPFCKNCHSILDPMAHFMSRWPKIGQDNFFYDTTAGISATGIFAGLQGGDTLGMGKVFSTLKDFETCAVKHSFKFLVGRDMNQSEISNMIPKLVDTFNKSGRTIWPVMQEIINSSSFKGGE